MPFVVQAKLDDHTLAAMTATAKEVFARAIECMNSDGSPLSLFTTALIAIQ